MSSAGSSLADRFRTLYGRAPDGVWAAPGRVNLIGEHVDYNDGLVLPFALTARTSAAVARRDDGLLRARLEGADGVLDQPVSALSPGSMQEWPAYVAGVVWVLRTAGHDVGGMDVLLAGDVPVGAGLSSSAALECSVALATNDLSGLGLDAPGLARVAQTAENDFVGVPCGLMDQMASMACTAGHALLYDVQADTAEQVPFDPVAAELALLVMDTKVKHSIGESAYADRRATCEAAARALGVASLRDIDPARLDADLAALADLADLAALTALTALASMAKLSADAVPRVRHVVGEIARVREAVAALRRGDWPGLGRAMTASHVSLRDDYEVSAAELDLAVATALDEGAMGARMTGGGFGGSAIALVPRDSVAQVSAAVHEAFRARDLRPPEIFEATPGPGAVRLS